MIGEVGHGRAAVGDPIAVGGTSLVGDLLGGDRKSLQFVLARLERRERPRAEQALGPDREGGWRHHAGQDGHCFGPVRLLGEVEITTRLLAVDRLAEWEALDVVPVEMGEEQAAVEGRTGQCRGEAPEACPASSTRVGASASWARATHEVLPPYRTNEGPGVGREPRTPSRWARTPRPVSSRSGGPRPACGAGPTRRRDGAPRPPGRR